jgi:signal transduction histidine kinase
VIGASYCDGDSIDRVFEPFWRGDAARSTEGAGLGLALSKRIVESLGGEIEVESDPSYGSLFAVLLRESGRALAVTRAS